MGTDGPAAPTEKNGAKYTNTKALLHCVTQIYRSHWLVGHNKLQGVQSAAPACTNKYDGGVDLVEVVASIGDKFDDLEKKAKC